MNKDTFPGNPHFDWNLYPPEKGIPHYELMLAKFIANYIQLLIENMCQASDSELKIEIKAQHPSLTETQIHRIINLYKKKRAHQPEQNVEARTRSLPYENYADISIN